MTSTPSSLRALRAVFHRLSPDQDWKRQLEQSARLRTLVEANLPSALVVACSAWMEGGGVLVLACANGAVAAKLKQLAPRLLQNFHKADGQISSIRVEVQAILETPVAAQKPRRIVPPPPSAAVQLELAAAGLHSPELAEAMRRLARNLRRDGT